MKFFLLVYAAQRTTNCVALAILIGTYQLVNDIRANSGNACIRMCMLQDRAPFKAKSAIQFWLDHESSYNRLSQLALFSWRLLPGTMFDDLD